MQKNVSSPKPRGGQVGSHWNLLEAKNAQILGIQGPGETDTLEQTLLQRQHGEIWGLNQQKGHILICLG